MTCTFDLNYNTHVFLTMKVLSILAFIVITSNAFSQIYFHNYGTTTISGSTYSIAPTSINPNLSGSSWSGSAGFIDYGGSTGRALSFSNSSGVPTMTLTFNVGSGCTLDITAFNFWCQRSSTGAQNWSLKINGTVVGSGNVSTGGAFVGSTTVTGMTGLTGTVTIVLTLTGASGTGTFRLDDFQLDGSTNCGTTNTITPGTITGGPFSVNCTGTTASGTISYSSTGTFTAGNTFTVQLSDASGSFASPTVIGTAASVLGSGNLSFTIPAGTPTGSGYRIRIIASTPSTTSTNSAVFTITQLGSCALIEPYISSIIYDGCDGACGSGNEGMSEIVFGNTGSYSIVVNSANIDLNYTTGSNNLTNTVVNNTATTTALNTAAGCPGLFVNAFGTTLPPNATFLMVSDALCVNALTWSDLCGQGPIYLIYGGAGASGNNWNNGGNFGNTGGTKNFSTSFTTTSGTFNANYNYTAPSGNTDGNYATYAIGSGTPATQGNFPNCTITPIALSSELIEYTGELVNNQSLLTWKTASERDNAEFSIQHSTNGVDWSTIGNVLGHGTTDIENNYSLTHINPEVGMNYYKLIATDNNGVRISLGIVPIQLVGNFAYYNQAKNLVEFNISRSIMIVSMDGKIVAEGTNVTQVEVLTKGVFIIQDLNTLEKQRIIIY